MQSKAEQLVADGKDNDLSIGTGRLGKALAAIATGREAMEGLRRQVAELDTIYQASPWPRYFPCTNRDGHIHSSLRGCPTVRWNTDMAWYPQLSGKTVAEAVAELGEALCSVCFPDAPAGWKWKTLGQVKDERTRAEREAAKAEREAKKAAKNLAKDEQLNDHHGWPVTTVAGAKQALRDEVEFRLYYGRGPHSFHPASAVAAARAREVLLARGVEAAELDKIVVNAERKHAMYAKAS